MRCGAVCVRICNRRVKPVDPPHSNHHKGTQSHAADPKRFRPIRRAGPCGPLRARAQRPEPDSQNRLRNHRHRHDCLPLYGRHTEHHEFQRHRPGERPSRQGGARSRRSTACLPAPFTTTTTSTRLRTTRTSTRFTWRCLTPCTPSTRFARRRRASTCCAKSRCARRWPMRKP